MGGGVERRQPLGRAGGTGGIAAGDDFGAECGDVFG